VWSAHSEPGLDAVRAVAALSVLVTHVAFQTDGYGGSGGRVLARLDVGVAIFFVLSGYLLAQPFLAAASNRRPAPPTRRYLWHRGLRILPAYWAAGAAAVLFVRGNGATTVTTIVRNALLVQVYRPGDLVYGFTQTWSLCVEVVFYLLLPLVAALMCVSLRRGSVRSALLVLAAMVVLNEAWLALAHATTLVDRSLVGFWLPSFLSWFAGGLALAVVRTGDAPVAVRLRRVAGEVSSAPLACWTLSAAALLVASTPVGGPVAFEADATAWQAVAKNLLYMVVAVFLVLPAAFGDPTRSRAVAALHARPWRFLGEVSYGVFLWHLVVLDFVVRARHDRLFGGGFVPVLGWTLVGSVALASASLVLLEHPVARYRDRGPGRRTAVSATTAASPAAAQT
jgi:peptidoglycan/LPS O-acetylase OafA/YrhL